MKIMVTGACGFIGSHFVEAALADDHEVLSVDCLTYAGRSENLGTRMFYRGDICDMVYMEALFDRFQPDAIVHLAAESHVGRSINCRDEFLRTNVMGTGVLLEVALAYWRTHPGFRFLHVSTDEVYGSLGLDEAPWTEESPYAPNNPYAASKASSDFLARSYFRTFGLPVVITHSSNNYGPRQHPEKLIPILVRQAAAGEALTLHGTGENVRDWIHVEDHCAGLLAALHCGEPGETYNFGGACERTNRQMAKLILDTARPGHPHRICLTADRPGNDLRYSTDTLKAFTTLGWCAGAQIEVRIAATVQWYLDNPNYDLDYGR
jgi:dTDP-glucose 4,6-dehydratase